MKKLLGIVVLGLIICNITYAKKNTNTWDYHFMLETIKKMIKENSNKNKDYEKIID